MPPCQTMSASAGELSWDQLPNTHTSRVPISAPISTQVAMSHTTSGVTPCRRAYLDSTTEPARNPMAMSTP